jgi:polar amino acid transport system substrate-binding protein
MYNSIPAPYFNDKSEWVGFDVDIAEEEVKRIENRWAKSLRWNR